MELLRSISSPVFSTVALAQRRVASAINSGENFRNFYILYTIVGTPTHIYTKSLIFVSNEGGNVCERMNNDASSAPLFRSRRFSIFPRMDRVRREATRKYRRTSRTVYYSVHKFQRYRKRIDCNKTFCRGFKFYIIAKWSRCASQLSMQMKYFGLDLDMLDG